MSKLCFLCGNKIGFVRTFWDQHYCSPEHRREARLASSQALREEEEVESWTVERSGNGKNQWERRPDARARPLPHSHFSRLWDLLVVAVLLPGPAAAMPTMLVSAFRSTPGTNAA